MARRRQSSNAGEITRRALAGEDARCRETVQMFCGWLGNVAGNLALTLGARGGVYIGGGIVPRLGEYFAISPFRTCFEAKGRFRNFLTAIPVYVITAKYPALIGCVQVVHATPVRGSRPAEAAAPPGVRYSAMKIVAGCSSRSLQCLDQSGRVGAIDEAVIERGGQVHHPPHRDGTGNHHGSFDRAVDADDRDLGHVDDRRAGDAAELAQAGHRDGRTG